MKKSVIILIIFLIFPLVSAIEFNMKEEFKQGETLLATVSGNFIEPILKEDIKFYRGHVRVPMEFGFSKIQNKFYIYSSLLGKNENNYSIVIENAKYLQGAETIEKDIFKNFSITNQTADFSIEPGFVTTTEDFFIEVQNLQDNEITITSKIFEQESEVTLISGEVKKINFEIENTTNSSFNTLELSTENLEYKISVYLPISGEEPDELMDFRFEPAHLDFSMSTNTNKTRTIYLFNTGEKTIENIELTISGVLENYAELSITEIDELEKDQEVKVEIYFNSSDEEKFIEGQITANVNNTLYTYCGIELNFIKDYIPSENDDDPAISKNCAEHEGTTCDYNKEECEGETIQARDGVCCLGTCKEIKKSSTGKLIGWSIVIIVIILLYWFFKRKFSKTKRESKLMKLLGRR